MIDKYVAKKLKTLLDNVRYYEEHNTYEFEKIKEIFDQEEDISEEHALILIEIMEEKYPEEFVIMKDNHVKAYWSYLEFAKNMEITRDMREVALYEYHPLFAEDDDGEYIDIEDLVSHAEVWIKDSCKMEHFTELDDYEIFERYSGITFSEWIKDQKLDEEETMKDVEECYGSLHSYFLDYGDHLPTFYLNVTINEALPLDDIQNLPSFDNVVYLSNGYGYNDNPVVEACVSENKTILSFAYHEYTTNQIDPVVSFIRFTELIQEVREYLVKAKAA